MYTASRYLGDELAKKCRGNVSAIHTPSITKTWASKRATSTSLHIAISPVAKEAWQNITHHVLSRWLLLQGVAIG